MTTKPTHGGTKPTHGGDRQGSGRPNKYGEPTVKKNYRIPISKVGEIEALLNSYKKPGK